MAGNMRLHLVRHPQPAVDPGICYGATDLPVTEGELRRVQERLAAAGLPGRLPLYTSPLRRCALLAARLRPLGVHIDARLAEMNFGRWEMRPWSGIARAEVDAWATDLLYYRPGGAENVLDVAQRVAAFVADLRADLRSSTIEEALLICHAGTIRLLRAMDAGLALEQAALQAAATPHRIGYGDILTLEI
jgi:alpha-ribazole phosphatase